ncbi:MAG: hypothetical protein JXX28_18040 [Deltaproteobacteria bacterium]|nr:hypothetical protein [Deltaproteobacteria bacterium]
MINLPAATYGSWFVDALWIPGGAEGQPTRPIGSYDAFHTYSQDWADFLAEGEHYALRQNFYKPDGVATVDVKYAFTCPGYQTQDEAPTDAARA